jgi:bleomycin hydrolase
MKYRTVFSMLFFCLSFPSFLSAQSVKDKLERELDRLPHPQSVSDFSSISHLSSMNQDSTLVCWSFATSSFMESEMKRVGREPVRLSVMFPVYYIFVEKAKRFVQSHGVSRFGPGDLFSGVIDIAKQYGSVPAEAYEGIKSNGTIYNHITLYAELDSVMSSVKLSGVWEEEPVLAKVTAILNARLGVPPKEFNYKGRRYSPRTFFTDLVRLNFDEYIMVTSFQYAPFNQFTALKVPDNWNNNNRYFNVPLDVFYRSLTNAVRQGYSAAIDMDNSEASYRMTKQYAFIPAFEVPKDSITQTTRERQFQSGATSDDHLMHLVAYKPWGTEDWFLAKDSWRTAWEGANHGYFFFHESYVKLKVLAYLVHRDGIPEITALLPSIP